MSKPNLKKKKFKLIFLKNKIKFYLGKKKTVFFVGGFKKIKRFQLQNDYNETMFQCSKCKLCVWGGDHTQKRYEPGETVLEK